MEANDRDSPFEERWPTGKKKTYVEADQFAKEVQRKLNFHREGLLAYYCGVKVEILKGSFAGRDGLIFDVKLAKNKVMFCVRALNEDGSDFVVDDWPPAVQAAYLYDLDWIQFKE